MRILLLFGVLILAACGPVQPAAAQRAPLKGLVWTMPSDLSRAEAELIEMHRMGVEAIRTGFILQERLLTLADTLGLHFFQELALDDLPAAALNDTLDYARRVLELAIERARNHQSARHFGLARRSDTSAPAACAFFEQLAARVHRLPNSRAYYLSAFIEADRCAGAVDFVLLDALDASDPTALLRRWQAAHASRPAGIGTLGTWVRTNAGTGLRAPHTPEAQARYLETHLAALLSYTAGPPLPAVFVYRRRDIRAPAPSPARDLARPYHQSYGLYTFDGAMRPARTVVYGFYTGTQTVFAFAAGTTPPQAMPWNLLFGWLVFILIAGCYAFSPRFRDTVPRYFLAHGFYRESIREGREVLLGSSVVLLIATALCIGVLGSLFLETMRHEAAFQFLFGIVPEPVQIVGVALLAQPWMLVLLLSSFYALGVALWTSLLSFASRRRQPLIPGQALMVVLWARWPSPLLMAGAMVVPTLPDAQAVSVMLLLAGAWVLTTLSVIVRTLSDYAAITSCSPYLVVAMAFANPLPVLLLISLFTTLATPDISSTLAFFWHLATRS